ncbi:50S ribosomal protein L11 methyltransferase [Bombilactobacillus folatiphilus]|uniref:50S ribosomal protein L11 methyltransferase n=1 Tax=Bombilactobacillus folatiphilus TaxID=2923362 RepID=A0ABY4P768_9LACO|nr:50S ribosomal protein L11 methyltransferase [Bombilactobacillus folatiphilus]UQS81545.1 50S ribosomal protein L11 methyltransferase [Bombilactobacillus folatiphilus]
MSDEKWNRLAILTEPQNFELISSVLIAQQILGIENLPNDQGLAIYLPAQQLTKQWCQELADQFSTWGLNAQQYHLQIQENVDMHWGKQWQQYYQPVAVTHFLRIVPAWQTTATPQPTEILMRPQESFGTGEHPTTKLCLQALEIYVDDQKSLIDVGTGTGILAIAAAKLGIKQLYGYDISSEAVQVARDNFQLNQLNATFTVQQNSLLDGIDQTASVVTANMLLEPLVALLPQLASHVQSAGYIILSGFLVEQIDHLTSLISQQPFVVLQTLTLDGWGCIIAQKELD